MNVEFFFEVVFENFIYTLKFGNGTVLGHLCRFRFDYRERPPNHQMLIRMKQYLENICNIS